MLVGFEDASVGLFDSGRLFDIYSKRPFPAFTRLYYFCQWTFLTEALRTASKRRVAIAAAAEVSRRQQAIRVA